MAAKDELPALEAKLAALTQSHPKEAMFSIMEALVDIACGDNPALRDYRREQLYIGILQKLAKKGIRP